MSCRRFSYGQPWNASRNIFNGFSDFILFFLQVYWLPIWPCYQVFLDYFIFSGSASSNKTHNDNLLRTVAHKRLQLYLLLFPNDKHKLIMWCALDSFQYHGVSVSIALGVWFASLFLGGFTQSTPVYHPKPSIFTISWDKTMCVPCNGLVT